MHKLKYIIPAILLTLTGCTNSFPIFGSDVKETNPPVTVNPTDTPQSETINPDSETVQPDTESTLPETKPSIPDTEPPVSDSESVDQGPTTDPYVGVSSYEFYKNYQPATTYNDAYYRTQHHFMSGSIEEQKQRPTIAKNQPKENGKFVKNITSGLSADGLSYDIVDVNGNVVNTIFKGGAYVTLEEVAAYVFAFGDAPANYDKNKSAKPTASPWGKYLRVNNNYYSNDVSQYPTEPELPDPSKYSYYEMDIGTTGSFEYSGNYRTGPYNNGSKIIRGSSRIVYRRRYSYGGGTPCSKPTEMKVFYTFDHYRDFQEYLNYEGGWGEWFGNIAGGADEYDETGKYKTPYPSVVERNF